MVRDLITLSAFLAVAIAIYRYHRKIAEALRRFDAQNVRRIRDQEQERADPLAHFKHTLRTAEEQVEDVSEITVTDERLGTPVTRYLFEGRQYGTRLEAEHVRAEKIRDIARNYYVDLPVALSEQRPQPAMHGTTEPNPPPPSKPPPSSSNVVPFRRGDETLH